MKILVTGGAGFIGSNFISYWLNKYPGDVIINLDSLTYAGNLDNLTEVEKNYGDGALPEQRRYWFVNGDIRNTLIVESLISKVDGVVHFAAESHVDRSITNPQEFLSTNILGTQTLLEAARKFKIKKFLHISTDEVYGSIETGYYSETAPLTPASPYAASKASADLLVRSYYETYKLPVIITRTTNNFGPYQHPEKFIPLFITNLMEGKKAPLYGYGLNRRDWIYVLDNCEALDLIFHEGRIGEVYNISTSSNEISNIEMSSRLARLLNQPPSLIEFVTDRPGHDFRYGVDSSKLRNELGWNHKYSLKEGLLKTIEWYKNNELWWRKIKEGDIYSSYYSGQYKK
ncbi:MAG: dTDP-glucose 4,6-dehydratase [bacterium]|nr:dTDP-glucose 4,6-dehydratase [bacterium]